MGSKLSACPCCAANSFRFYTPMEVFGYAVGCTACGMRGPIVKTEEEAKKKWNDMKREQPSDTAVCVVHVSGRLGSISLVPNFPVRFTFANKVNDDRVLLAGDVITLTVDH